MIIILANKYIISEIGLKYILYDSFLVKWAYHFWMEH